MIDEQFIIKVPPKPNLELQVDETPIMVALRVRPTLGNKIKWWLFCQVFPFKIIKWGRMEE